jgi:hypothetical protein
MSQATTSPLYALRQLQIRFWVRRAAFGIMRAAWIALLVPVAVMIGYLWQGWQVPWYLWVPLMLLIGLIVMLWSMRPIRMQRIVHRMDDRMALQTRLTTAYEISKAPDADEQAENPVVQGLYEETEEIADVLRDDIRVMNRAMWVEFQALIAVAAMLGALLMADALAPRLPHEASVDIPAEWQEPRASQLSSDTPPLAESIAPEEANTSPMHEEDFQKALEILADVLRDHAVTHSIADAIDKTDTQLAANNLRRLADQLDDLSPQTRLEVGGLFQEAAGKIGNIAPSISTPLQDGSDALAIDDLLAAGVAIEELARVIEQIEDDPTDIAEYKPVEEEQIENPEPVELEQEEQNQQQQQSGEQQQSEQEPPPEEERLSVEGEPLEIESDPETDEKVVEAADPDAEATEEEAEGTPFTRQPLISTNQELGADPLVYPWERREIVRRYFTP